MGLRLYEYLCRDCDKWMDVLVEFEDRQPTVTCEHCGTGTAEYHISAPPVMGVAIADCVGRKNDQGYQRMKEASKLEVAKANLPVEKRGEIQREINKLQEGTKK